MSGWRPAPTPPTLKDEDKITLTQSAVVLEKLIGQFLYGKAAEGGSKQ